MEVGEFLYGGQDGRVDVLQVVEHHQCERVVGQLRARLVVPRHSLHLTWASHTQRHITLTVKPSLMMQRNVWCTIIRICLHYTEKSVKQTMKMKKLSVSINYDTMCLEGLNTFNGLQVMWFKWSCLFIDTPLIRGLDGASKNWLCCMCQFPR